MKRYYTILFLMLGLGYAQAQKKIQQPTLDLNYPDIDTVVSHSDYLLKVNVDTLYLINKQALLSYKTCRESYSALRTETEQMVELKSTIENVDKEFTLLNKNLTSLETKYTESLNENIKTNIYLKTQNKQIEEELKIAKENLSKAQQQIKSEKWNSKATKMAWGIGGVLVSGTAIALLNGW